jgi:hypothetical protein
MANRFQFSVATILAATAIVAVVFWVSKAIGPINTGFVAGFSLAAAMLFRWQRRGLPFGVLTAWASVLLGTFVELEFSHDFLDALPLGMFFAIWAVFGWLFAGICLIALYWLQLVSKNWGSTNRLVERRQSPDA